MKTRWAGIVAGLLAVLVFAPASQTWADDAGPRVSVDFRSATMREAADFLSVKAGVNIVVERGVAGQVSLRVNDVNWLDVLNIAAKQVGCTVNRGGEGIYYVVSPHFSFTTKAEGVSLKQVVSLLAQQSGQNIVVAPKVDAIVHFNLQDVPWQIALDTIVKTAGPYTVVRDDAGVYRVVETNSLFEQLETRVFKLKYIQPPSEYKPKMSSEFAERRQGGTTANDLKENFTLYKALSEVVAKSGSVQYDFDSNAFIVTSTRPLLDDVAEIIRLVDVPVDQVFIDVKFVTTGHRDLLNAGVRYPKGFMITGSGGSMVHRLPFNLNGGGWLDSISVTGTGPTPDDVATALGGESPYTFGVLDFSNITPVLEFLKTDRNSEIVQAPTLTVIDNKAATVFIGDQIHFAEEFSTTNQGGQLSRGIREASQNSPIKVGTQLMVMPHIVPDTNKIVLSIIPSSEQLTGTSSPTVTGFERFSVGDSFIDLPKVSSRTVVTTMLLEDGQTAVIGGLIDQSNSNVTTKLPFFGDLPVVGWLFKNKQINTDVNNLYIFITVRIIRNSADVQSIFAEYNVPGATLKPYRPGVQYPAQPLAAAEPVVTVQLADAPEPAAAAPADPVPAAPVRRDVIGIGWEESQGSVETFEVRK